jgi:hypothetical protein
MSSTACSTGEGEQLESWIDQSKEPAVAPDQQPTGRSVALGVAERRRKICRDVVNGKLGEAKSDSILVAHELEHDIAHDGLNWVELSRKSKSRNNQRSQMREAAQAKDIYCSTLH